MMKFGFVFSLFLGIVYLIWELYKFVMQGFCPMCPESLTSPSYWLFLAGWVLLYLIAKVFKK
jgi:Sec-independent protein secretion pathway component TatC